MDPFNTSRTSITLIHAVEIQPRDSLHSGVVKEGDFTIFPQNRLGNGLYRNGTLMASEADQQIIGSQPILGIESIVYLYRDVNGQEGLGLVNGINEGTGRLKKSERNFMNSAIMRSAISGFSEFCRGKSSLSWKSCELLQE